MRDRTPTQTNKDELRRRMRNLRRELPDRAERSEQIRDRLLAMTELVQGKRIMLFAAIPGEPEMTRLQTWCETQGKATSIPEDNFEPAWPDVVIVPGLAFTPEGDRLGQGGGWYDRFLSSISPSCTTVGVGFDMQMVDTVPTEPHDVTLDFVVTDRRVVATR